jgi:hypothetical protein
MSAIHSFRMSLYDHIPSADIIFEKSSMQWGDSYHELVCVDTTNGVSDIWKSEECLLESAPIGQHSRLHMNHPGPFLCLNQL